MKVAIYKSPNSRFTQIFCLLFAFSMALGNWNPFVQTSDSEDSATSIATIVTVLFIPYLILHAGSKRWWNNKYSIPLYIFFCVILCSSTFNADILNIGFLVFYAKLFAGILLCVLLPVFMKRDPHLIYISLLVYALSCALIGTSIFMGYGEQYMSVQNGRMWLFGENPNTTSGRYGMAVIMLFYLIFSNPLHLNKIRYVFLPLLFPLMSLIVMSGSRGSLLITAMSIFLYIIFVNRKNMVKGVATSVVAIIPLAIYTISQIYNSEFSMMERLTSSMDERGGNEIRNRLFWASFDIFIHNPILGMGTADFKAIMTHSYGMEHTAHNLYIYILATSGIVGFIPFALFLFRLFKGTYRKVKETVLPLLLLFFICVIAYKTGGILTYLFMWYIFAIIISSVETHFV